MVERGFDFFPDLIILLMTVDRFRVMRNIDQIGTVNRVSSVVLEVGPLSCQKRIGQLDQLSLGANNSITGCASENGKQF